MHVYLPIAEMPVDGLALLVLGAAVGVLSGIFGVGGGFMLTPLLIFMGIPPAIAVASSANQLVGASVSGMLVHLRRGNVDLRMGLILLAGGVAGSGAGVWLFGLLRRLGQVDLVIGLSYVALLSVLGTLMLAESVTALLRSRRATAARRRLHAHTWLHRLPLRMRFPASRLYVSALLPLAQGFVVGVLSAIMGVGGGFVMVPAMIYTLGMPSRLVPGTSLFQIMFVAAAVTVLQALGNHTVDVVLAGLLLAGGVVGAQVGGRIGARLPGVQMRVLFALMVLGLGGTLAFDLMVTPDALFSARILP